MSVCCPNCNEPVENVHAHRYRRRLNTYGPGTPVVMEYGWYKCEPRAQDCSHSNAIIDRIDDESLLRRMAAAWRSLP